MDEEVKGQRAEVRGQRSKVIPICSREDGEIAVREVAYEGRLEAKTMGRVNKLFLEKAGSGYFYPLDAMDAYDDVWLALEAKAANLPELARASAHTYLSGVARLMFLNWFKRKVEPARQTYRRVEDRHFGKKGAVGIDDFDIDNYDATEGAPSAAMRGAGKGRSKKEEGRSAEGDLGAEGRCGEGPTAFELGERLRDESGACGERIRRARETLEEVFAAMCGALGERALPIVRAFRAYVAADGNFIEAARIAHVSRTKFYRKWPGWIAAAKNSWEKSGMVRH